MRAIVFNSYDSKIPFQLINQNDDQQAIENKQISNLTKPRTIYELFHLISCVSNKENTETFFLPSEQIQQMDFEEVHKTFHVDNILNYNGFLFQENQVLLGNNTEEDKWEVVNYQITKKAKKRNRKEIEELEDESEEEEKLNVRNKNRVRYYNDENENGIEEEFENEEESDRYYQQLLK